MKKKWYDNWKVIYNNIDGQYEVSLPNSKSETKFFSFKPNHIKKKELQEFIILMDCALTELSARDEEEIKAS